MGKKILLCAITVSLVLSGCSLGASADCPAYFTPIIEEMEENPEKYLNTGCFVIDKWWTQGVQSGTYDDKVYTSYFDGVTQEFDLSDVLQETDTWTWLTAGAFQTKGEERTYIALIDFNLTLEDGTEPSPQIMLLDYATDNPKDYQVTPYTVEPAKEFCWVEQCYRMNDKIYIGSSGAVGSDGAMHHLGRIDLTTREFYDCKKEWQAISSYAESKFEEGYYPNFFRTVLEQDGITVYSASISEANDTPCIGAVLMAYQNDTPIAYMTVDLTAEKIADGLEIEIKGK